MVFKGPVCCQGLDLGWLCARQAPSLLSTLKSLAITLCLHVLRYNGEGMNKVQAGRKSRATGQTLFLLPEALLVSDPSFSPRMFLSRPMRWEGELGPELGCRSVVLARSLACCLPVPSRGSHHTPLWRAPRSLILLFLSWGIAGPRQPWAPVHCAPCASGPQTN